MSKNKFVIYEMIWCTCGAVLKSQTDHTIRCERPDCQHAGKVFRPRTVELEEVVESDE